MEHHTHTTAEKYDQKHSHGKTAPIESGKKPVGGEADLSGGLPSQPPSNQQIVNVLDTMSTAIDKEKTHTTEPKMVKHMGDLVDAARDITLNKNEGEHLQKAFVASARAAKETERTVSVKDDEGTTYQARQQIRQTIPQLTRDLFFQLLTDSEFRSSVTSMLGLIRDIANEDVESDLHVPENYHVDPKEPSTTSTAVNPTQDEVVTTTVKRVPIKPDTEKHSYSKLTPSLRESLRKELNTTLVKFAQNPRYNKSVEQLFDLIDLYQENLHEHVAKTVKDSDNVATAGDEMKKFAANFVEDDNLNDLIRRVRKLAKSINKDEEMRKWVAGLRIYVRRIMRDPERDLETEKMRERSERLINNGHKLLRDPKYREQVHGLARDWHQIISEIKDDKELNAFTKALKKMYDDVTITKKDGSTSLDFNALSEMRGVLLAVFKDLFKDITLPDYSGTHEHYEYKLQGTTVHVADLVPDQITILHETEANIVLPKSHQTDPKHTSDKSELHGTLIVRAHGIMTHLNNTNFWYKHTTFPKREDSGTAEMDIYGKGMDIEIRMDIRTVAGQMQFVDGVVWVHVDKFKLKLHDTKHHAFYSLFKRTIRAKVSQMVTQRIADMIAQGCTRIGTSLNQLMVDASPEKFASSFFSTVDTVRPGAPKTKPSSSTGYKKEY